MRWGSFAVYGVKLHLLCSTNRVPLSYDLTAANVADVCWCANFWEDLNGRTSTMNPIYEVHSVGKPFIKKNYKQALQSLYTRGAIGADPMPKKGTFADYISVSFLAIPS